MRTLKNIGLFVIFFLFISAYTANVDREIQKSTEQARTYRLLSYSSIAAGACLMLAGTSCLMYEIVSAEPDSTLSYTPYALFLSSIIPFTLKSYFSSKENELHDEIGEMAFDEKIDLFPNSK